CQRVPPLFIERRRRRVGRIDRRKQRAPVARTEQFDLRRPLRESVCESAARQFAYNGFQFWQRDRAAINWHERVRRTLQVSNAKCGVLLLYLQADAVGVVPRLRGKRLDRNFKTNLADALKTFGEDFLLDLKLPRV